MSEAVDKEVDAIKVVLAALTPLSPDVRTVVLEYVLRRLGYVMSTASVGGHTNPSAPIAPPAQGQQINPPTTSHIKELKGQKKPRSANEMAVLVAYYLANIAPQEQRKQSVSAKDLETYFKIAEYPLPEQIRVTLGNAKNAGYFDLVGEGEYRLNPVGYNLVVHSMPRGVSAASNTPRRNRTAKKPRAKTKK